MKTFLSILLFFVLSNFLFAQEIISKVIDENSNEPVVFATIKLKNKSIGVIADENGNFRLPIKYKQQNDTLIISSIGYTNKEILTSHLKEGELNIIKLLPKVEALEEVVLVSKKRIRREELSAQAIVSQAIQNIDINFPKNPFSYIGYYRDYQLLKDNYVNLNEAIIQVYDAGFLTDKVMNSLNQSILFNYKKNTDFIRDPKLEASYSESKYIKNATLSAHGGNELTILNTHDPIRNYNKESFSFVGIFNKDFLRNHTFSLKKTLFLGDIALYEIGFSTTKYVMRREYKANGTIYISKNNFAIHKLDYEVFTKNKKSPLFSVKVEYLPKGDRMYLNYISFNNEFEVKSKNDFKLKGITFDKDLKLFNLEFNNVVASSSVKNQRNFKFKYKGTKLTIDKIRIIKPKIIEVALASDFMNSIDMESVDLSDFKYSIKNIVDYANRKLDKSSVIKVNQLREFFVQEVLQNKPLSDDKHYVRKTANLSESLVNNTDNIKEYWVNTPLQKSQNR